MPVINLESNQIILMTKALRVPIGRFVGSGIYMSFQTFGHPLKAGDHCFDADFGYMVYDGREWLSDKDVKEQLCDGNAHTTK